MNFILTSVIVLLVKCVGLGSCTDDITDLNKNVVNLEKYCGPGSKPCVVKCCGENEVIRKKNKKFACKDINLVMKEVNGSNTLLDQLTNYPAMKISSRGNVSRAFKKDFNLLQSKKFAENLNSIRNFMLFDEEFVTFTEDGNLTIENIETIKAPRFCVDLVLITVSGIPKNETYKYFIEIDDRSLGIANKKFNLYGYIVSSFFISLVLLVYGLLKDLHGCVPGLLLMTYIATLMLYYIILACVTQYQINMISSETDEEEFFFDVCKRIKPLHYFLFLSTLTWLNSMSFNIWLKFRKMKSVANTPKGITRAVIMKFLRYSLYAWGVPVGMTVTAILIDTLAADDSIKPNLINCKTNYLNSAHEIMYRYIPQAIVMFFNIMLYLMTVYNIWLINRNTNRLNRADSSRSRKNNSHLRLFSIMFVIMGIGWVIDLAQIPIEKDLDHWLHCLLNIYSAYIGVIIFIAMVCKRRVFNKLCDRFGIENRWTHRIAQNTSSTRTETSKVSKSLSKGRARASSSDFESTQFSEDDTKEYSKRNWLQNPKFTVSKTRTEL